MEAIILAGGMGTRLKPVLANIPKPMAPVGDKPFLGYLFKYLELHGIDSVILSVGYRYELIAGYFGNRFGKAKVRYSVEDEPLGTGGAVKKALEMVHSQEAVILNGDSFFPVFLGEMHRKHLELNSDISVALKPMKQFSRYGNVRVSGARINGFEEKVPVDEGLINGGIYIFNRNVFERFQLPAKFSLEGDFFQPYVNNRLVLTAFVSDEYFIDIGIPEDYYKARQELLRFL
jgi:D-glycero-alpha-D-manno-heptose 1-phosphate guanylyltransferase